MLGERVCPCSSLVRLGKSLEPESSSGDDVPALVPGAVAGPLLMSFGPLNGELPALPVGSRIGLDNSERLRFNLPSDRAAGAISPVYHHARLVKAYRGCSG